MMTSATLYKRPLFNSPEKLTLLENQLLSLSKQYQWDLEAWAVFANHLHFIARNDNSYSGGSLKDLIGQLHADTARELNRLDNEQGRTVWYNFWDTRLTFQE